MVGWVFVFWIVAAAVTVADTKPAFVISDEIEFLTTLNNTLDMATFTMYNATVFMNSLANVRDGLYDLLVQAKLFLKGTPACCANAVLDRWTVPLWILLIFLLLLITASIVGCIALTVFFLCGDRRRKKVVEPYPPNHGTFHQAPHHPPQSQQLPYTPMPELPSKQKVAEKDHEKKTPKEGKATDKDGAKEKPKNKQKDVAVSDRDSDEESVPVASKPVKDKAKVNKADKPGQTEKPEKTNKAPKTETGGTEPIPSEPEKTKSPLSPTSVPKTPKKAKGVHVDKGVQTDYDTSSLSDSSDDEQFKNKVRGNESMPGRDRTPPKTELLV